MRAFVLSARASTTACAAVLGLLLAFPAEAVIEHEEVATGVVRVLNAAVLIRGPDGLAKVIVLHMPADAAKARDLAAKIVSAGTRVPALKLVPTTHGVATGNQRAEAAAIRKLRPASIVAYNLEASIVNRLGALLRNENILSITTRKDDVYNNRWAVAVTGPDAILYSAPVLRSTGFFPLGVGADANPAPASDRWYAPYVAGVRIAKLPHNTRAAWVEVDRKMQQALEVRSREARETINREEVAYLPHFYRGVALKKLGEPDRAIRELRLSEQQEVILDIAPLHKQLRQLIDECLAELQKRGGVNGV